MKAHISNTDEKLSLEIQTRLLKIRQDGLIQGAKAISKVVYDKATDESKTFEERIEDIKKFCLVSLGKEQMEAEEQPA